jgi:hypothetical protein
VAGSLYRSKSANASNKDLVGALVNPIRPVKVRGLERVDQLFVLTAAASNLTGMRTFEQIRVQTA